MDRKIDRLIVKHVLKVPMAQTSEAFIEGWLDGQNFYSTKVDDAMKVTERFNSWQVAKFKNRPAQKYRAILDSHVGYGDTLPMAICQAALKSVGLECHLVGAVGNCIDQKG